MHKKVWLILAVALFGWFVVNVLVGKWAISQADPPGFLVGDIGEFLILFLSVICFVVTILIRESEVQKTNQ